MKKSLALLLAAVMLIAAFTGCGESKKKETAHGWVNHYLSNTISTLNHYVTTDTNNLAIGALVTGTLYEWMMNEQYDGVELLPVIAADKPTQLDTEGKKWQIKLRKDYKWSDGTLMTADDIIYSLQMLLDPIMYNQNTANATGAYSAPVNFYEYQQESCTWDETGVKKVDDYTLEITTANATTQQDVMEYWAMQCTGLVHKETFERTMSEDRSITQYGTSIGEFVSSGQFILKEWLPAGKVSVERNPNHPYSERIKIEGINYQVIPDANTALEIFLQGGIDSVGISVELWDVYEDDPRLYEYFDDSLMYMFVNVGNPEQNGLLGNWNFRDALYWGTDRDSMCEIVKGYPVSRLVRNSVIGDPVTGKRYIDMPGATDFIDDPATLYQPERANTALAKALEECKLTSGSLEIIYPETSANNRARNEFVQKQYGDTFGGKLNVKLRAVPSGQTLVLRRWDPSNPTSYEANIGSLYPSAESPHYTFMYYTSDYNPPRVAWSSPEFDALYKRAESREAQENNDLLLSLCYQMEKIILDERLFIPMYETPTKLLFSERIQVPTEEFVLGLGLASGAGFGYPKYVSIVE